MHLTINRSDFLRALVRVTGVVERRTTIPIVSNVLLKTGDGAVSARATDLERDVSESAPATVTRAGAVTVGAHVLHDIVRKFPEKSNVELSQAKDGGPLTVVAGRSRFVVPSLPARDFPSIGLGVTPHEFRMSAPDLRAMIEVVRIAMSTDETRYYMNGIFLHPAQESLLRGVSTDGHRMVRSDLAAPAGSSGMPGIIVPRKTIDQLHRMLEARDGLVDVAVSPTMVRFVVGGSSVLVSKLIDGTFPDVDRVIPWGNAKILDVGRSDLMAAVDRVSTIASEKGRGMRMRLGPSCVTVSVTSMDGGSASEDVCAVYDGPELEIGFNARYLLDIAGQIESDRIVIKLDGPATPAIICAHGDDGALCVLMPMRV